jgi:hypothetical protein
MASTVSSTDDANSKRHLQADGGSEKIVDRVGEAHALRGTQRASKSADHGELTRWWVAFSCLTQPVKCHDRIPLQTAASAP